MLYRDSSKLSLDVYCLSPSCQPQWWSPPWNRTLRSPSRRPIRVTPPVLPTLITVCLSLTASRLQSCRGDKTPTWLAIKHRLTIGKFRNFSSQPVLRGPLSPTWSATKHRLTIGKSRNPPGPVFLAQPRHYVAYMPRVPNPPVHLGVLPDWLID